MLEVIAYGVGAVVVILIVVRFAMNYLFPHDT